MKIEIKNQRHRQKKFTGSKSIKIFRHQQSSEWQQNVHESWGKQRGWSRMMTSASTKKGPPCSHTCSKAKSSLSKCPSQGSKSLSLYKSYQAPTDRTNIFFYLTPTPLLLPTNQPAKLTTVISTPHPSCPGILGESCIII